MKIDFYRTYKNRVYASRPINKRIIPKVFHEHIAHMGIIVDDNLV